MTISDSLSDFDRRPSLREGGKCGALKAFHTNHHQPQPMYSLAIAIFASYRQSVVNCRLKVLHTFTLDELLPRLLSPRSANG